MAGKPIQEVIHSINCAGLYPWECTCGAIRENDMALNSRVKGANGEREFAEVLRAAGFPDARRDGQQGFGGSHEDPDVRGLPGWHVEVKRTEVGGSKAYEWLSQAVRDAGTSGRRPVVAHRRNRSDWIAIIPMDVFLTLVKEAQNGARPQLEEPNSWVPPYVAWDNEGNTIPAGD